MMMGQRASPSFTRASDPRLQNVSGALPLSTAYTGYHLSVVPVRWYPFGGARKVISYLRGLQIQEVRVAIGDRIREVRKAAGLTQEDVARRAGITLKAVGELERSEVQDPHISSLTKISRALDVEVADLLREPVPLGEAPAGAEPATSYSFEIATAPEVLLEGLHNLGIPAGWTEAEALSQWLRRHAENS